MSALGQKQTSRHEISMSALPPKAAGMSALCQKRTYAPQQTTAVIQLPRQRVQAVRAEGLIRSLWLSWLTISRNRVGNSTGGSDGFLPFKILSTKVAHSRDSASRSAEYDASPPTWQNAEFGETAGKRRCKARSAINFCGSAGWMSKASGFHSAKLAKSASSSPGSRIGKLRPGHVPAKRRRKETRRSRTLQPAAY